MLFTLEALDAAHGDALLLHWGKPDRPRLAVIDGGPAGVFARSLLPRLEQLRASRAAGGALPIRLAMISHIDADHIVGILDWLNRMVDAADDGEPPAWKVDAFWLNSFDDILGNEADELAAAVRSAAAAAAADRPLPADFPFRHKDSALVAASVNQGRKVRDQLARLKIRRNAEADGKLVTADIDKVPKIDLKDGLKFTVLAPFAHRVKDLQEEWDKTVEKVKKAQPGEAQAIAAEFLDDSVFNLSSIVVLAEANRKRMLLTGDARGDDIIAGLEAARLVKQGRTHVDLLKIPHHGSERNVSTPFFRQVTADHYVISADGKHGNPDRPMLEMLTQARGSDAYTIHLTNLPGPPHEAKTFLDRDRRENDRNYTVVVRDTTAPSLRIDLGDKLTD